MGLTLLVLTLVMGPSDRSNPVASVQQDDKTTNIAITDSDTYGLPVRLSIPKIGVDTSVLYMGLTASGDMEAPQTNEDAGWYKYGPRPGNTGSAVIAGHVGVGSHAVFTQLNLLVKGDIVSVTDDKGQTISFVVREVRTFSRNTEPTEVFKSTTGAHLNLITCDGTWDAGESTYSERLVVFTDKLT